MIYRAKSFSVRDCIAGGWALFRKNIAIIVIFVIAIFFANFLTTIFLTFVKVAIRDHYSLFGEVGDLFSIYNGPIAPSLPLQNIMVLLLEILLEIVSGFVTLCGTALVTARSLLILNHREYSPDSVRELLRPNAIRLLKVWLVLYLISLSAIYLTRFASSYQQFLFLNSHPLNNLAKALTGFSLLTNMVVTFVLFAVMQYCICNVISGNSGIVRESISLAKQTIGKIVIFYIFFGMLNYVPLIPKLILKFLNPETFVLISVNGYISILGIIVLAFFQTTILTALFFHTSKAESFEETEYESSEISFSENEPEVNISEDFHYRAAPSLLFESVGEFHSGLARVKEETIFGTGKWGYADTEGNLKIPYQYNEAGNFSEGLAAVKKGRYKFYIDKNDEVVIDALYDEANMFNSGLAVVKIGVHEGFINHDGDMQSLPYDKIYGFSEELALVYDGCRWSYLDKTMKPVLHIEYKEARSFSEGLAAVAIETKKKLLWGYIDRGGNEVIPPQFEQAGLFKEGRAAVRVNGKFGHIDMSGKLITPAEYEEAGDFNDGFAFVKDEYFGYVDLEGIERIPLIYLVAGSFSERLAWVKMENGWGILQISGKDIENNRTLTYY